MVFIFKGCLSDILQRPSIVKTTAKRGKKVRVHLSNPLDLSLFKIYDSLLQKNVKRLGGLLITRKAGG
ncbi:hypothetical protein PEPS_34050 (plasmid) [Persicobacter psychrovividus]|uniref:Uncharacterized protein n=1 Tax=Persicobacter psychrovividus TaxID=387638 RepID=A0ABM7VJG7_9BACT|nr:hypothetical protein PEPS_34050 [Persicobacter psychrovividus]